MPLGNFPTRATIYFGPGRLVVISLYTEAFRFASAPFVQPFSFSEVIFALVIGGVIWNEIPDLWSILGGILIVGSGMLLLRLNAT